MGRFSHLDQINEIKKNQTGTGLLIENEGHIITSDDNIKQIKEDIAKEHKFVIPDDFIVSAVFQKFGIKNANGRIYPEDILKREVDRYITNCVKQNCAIGALDHPIQSTLSGHDVAMRILNLEWQNRTLVGEMKLHLSEGFKRHGIVSTSGDKVAMMLLDDILIGVSSRGIGSVKKIGDDLYVSDDFEIICWDVVCTPSTPGALIKNNRTELQQFIESEDKNGSSLNEKLDKLENLLF